MKYRKSDYLEIPHGNSFVWRYMNDKKFTDLLKKDSLFFPNANKLSDKYEVSVPDSVIIKKRKELESSGLYGRELEEEMASFYWYANPMKDLVLINCWSINQHESYALWKIYLGGEKNGVAIKSTVSKLKKSVQIGNDIYPEEFFMGKVKYKKHLNPDELSRLSVITTKKPFYDFERELRLFILNYPMSEGGTETPYDMTIGRSVKVDLDVLVKEIYISPFADESYKNKVQRLIENSLSVKSNSINYDGITVKESEIRDQ